MALYSLVNTWHPEQPFFFSVGWFSWIMIPYLYEWEMRGNHQTSIWMTPNLYIKNDCLTGLTKHPFKTGCFGYLVIVIHLVLESQPISNGCKWINCHFYVLIWFVIQLKQPLTPCLFRVPGVYMYLYNIYGNLNQEQAGNSF